MGKSKHNETRERIILAARQLFMERGQDGLNMRDLAEQAGVNKGLLHYYFKTKESIFREVFQYQAGRLYTEILDIVEMDCPFDRKVEAMVGRYFHMLSETPALPAFVMFEVQRDPGLVANSPIRAVFLRIATSIEPELRLSRSRPAGVSGVQFLLDMLSLCVYVFAILPGLRKVMRFNKKEEQLFLLQRQQHIVQVLQKSLVP